ncbi:MAG: cbb3-type cytochrome oxidase assembly protein CcoS [Pricia sp.]
MSVIYVLLAISLTVAIIFFVAFIISVRNGQYDDSYTPSVRMLFDDELVGAKGTERPVASKETKAKIPISGPERNKVGTHKAKEMVPKKNSTHLNKQV